MFLSEIKLCLSTLFYLLLPLHLYFLSLSQGLQWSLLKEEEVIPRILAMEGRRGRPPNSDRQSAGEGSKANRRRKGRPPNVGEPLVPEGPSPSEVKLLRKLEAQGEQRK